MTDPSPPGPVPGEQPPAGRLARPPSERYGSAAPSGTAVSTNASRAARLRAFGPAIGVGVATSVLLALVGGVLAEFRGLLAISGLGGAILGLVAARAVVPAAGRPPLLSRGDVVRGSMLLGAAAVIGGALLTWAYARLEGGVLDPWTYLWTTFGPLVVAEVALGVVGAAWGARSGPIRGS